MVRQRILVVALAILLIAAACGRSDESADTGEEPDTAAATEAPTDEPSTSADPTASDTGETASTTESATATTADPCEGVTLEATEIGVSETTITVVVMADVGSELAPGLFQGNLDGVKAWAETVNANDGLACRQVEVIEWDSKINATEATNGWLEACAKAAALVGSNSLFVGDVTITTECVDMAGDPVGIADIAERAVDAKHGCAPNVFSLSGINGSCPFESGERTYQVQSGVFEQYQAIAGEDLHGIYLVPSDLPSTIESSMPTLKGFEAAGLGVDGFFGVSGRAEQAVYAEYVAAMAAAESNYAQNGSNDQAMIKLRAEAVAQGLDPESVLWACSLSCYTEAYRDDPNAEGTYLWLPFMPFEDRGIVEEADTFLTAVGQDFPQSWAVGAWNAGRAFEQAINTIVAADGPNGITRGKILETIQTITEFDANGFIGTVDFSQRGITPCFVLLQLTGGEYVRIHPEEPGTLDCEPSNLTTWTGDSQAEFSG